MMQCDTGDKEDKLRREIIRVLAVPIEVNWSKNWIEEFQKHTEYSRLRYERREIQGRRRWIIVSRKNANEIGIMFLTNYRITTELQAVWSHNKLCSSFLWHDGESWNFSTMIYDSESSVPQSINMKRDQNWMTDSNKSIEVISQQNEHRGMGQVLTTY